VGGRGSGFQGIKAAIVEDCLVLSIAELLCERILVPGVAQRCNWSWPGCNAKIQIDSDLLNDVHATVCLRYIAAGEPINTWIFLAVTKPRFGGRRWWFKCPETGRRVAKLYLPPGEVRFASRQAYALSYRSSQESGRRERSERFWRRLAQRLGGNP
jgi:hypothetical protein